MQSSVIGKTVEDRDIEAFSLGKDSGNKVLIIGGVHGDEVEGIIAAYGILNSSENLNSTKQVVVIPVLNVDGYKANTRQNSHGIDLNRNLPTRDWTSAAANQRYTPGSEPNSEPENQSLLKFIDNIKPKLIISLHSYKEPMLNINGDCKDIAQQIAKLVDCPVKEDIGYSTPGCLGTYYGLERGVPVLTYEFLRGLERQQIESIHVPAILAALK